MRIRWRDFELPTRVVVERETYTNTYGKFFVEPFERGFGSTIGNSLRRVLLSSIEGSAITSVKIEGIKHEFGIVPGVVEDVTEIILSLKQVRFKQQIEGTDSETVVVTVSGQDQLTAGDIGKFTSAFQVLNPDLVTSAIASASRIGAINVVKKFH